MFAKKRAEIRGRWVTKRLVNGCMHATRRSVYLISMPKLDRIPGHSQRVCQIYNLTTFRRLLFYMYTFARVDSCSEACRKFERILALPAMVFG